jgi:hypothetical protein
MSILQTESKTGNPIQAGDFEITPMNLVSTVQLPGHHVGLVWNRPKTVVVRTLDGQEKNLPVMDITRIIIWTILAAGLLGTILIRFLYWKK